MTNTTWTGTVTGDVSRIYDNDFRLASQSVNGSHTVSFQYDQDSLLMGAGALTLNRDAQTGLLTGSTLGSITDTWTYNSFAEPLGYTVTASGSPLFEVQYTRDDLGRITQKAETIAGVTGTFDYTYNLSRQLTAVTQNGTSIALTRTITTAIGSA